MADTLLRDVSRAMHHHSVRQKDLAVVCGCTQGHISKVLRGKAVLSVASRTALTGWLSTTPIPPEEVHSDIDALVRRLNEAGHDHMHIMQILNGLVAIVERTR